MKEELTLSIDKELLSRAEAAARRQGRSPSEVVEEALRETSQAQPPSFVDECMGAFEPAHRQGDRYKYLAKKYL